MEKLLDELIEVVTKSGILIGKGYYGAELEILSERAKELRREILNYQKQSEHKF
jgi:hypothetical protein